MKKRNIIKQAKQKRLKMQISIREMATLVGVSFSALAKLENGVGQPSKSTYERLVKWVDMDEQSEPHERLTKRTWYSGIEKRLSALEAKVFQ